MAFAIVAVIAASASTVVFWSDEIPKMGAEIQQKLGSLSHAVENMRDVTEDVEKHGTNDTPAKEVVVKRPGLLDTAFDTFTQISVTFVVTMVLAMLHLSSGEMF